MTEIIKIESIPMQPFEREMAPDRLGVTDIYHDDLSDEEDVVKLPVKTTWAKDVQVGQTRVFNGGYMSVIENVRNVGGSTWIQTTARNGKTYDTEYPSGQWVVILEDQDESTQFAIDFDRRMRERMEKVVAERIAELEAKGEPLFTSTQFRHKETGHITTIVPLENINEYEKV